MEAKKRKRNALGRGLSALISSPLEEASNETPSAEDPKPAASSSIRVVQNQDPQARQEANPVSQEMQEAGRSVRIVPIEQIENNPLQPRQDFDPEELRELAESISVFGVLQPILVRKKASDRGPRFEIIAGERRWRASRIAGLSELPVLIHQVDEKEKLEIALVENVQRENLNPIEEALAYQRLHDDHNLSQQQIAKRVGKDRASVANIMRLLNLAPSVQEMLKEESISVGHAKALLTVKEPSAQVGLANKILKERLSVRALEEIVQRVVVLESPKKKSKTAKTKAAASALSAYPEVVDRLRKTLGTKVAIRKHESGRGRIEIEYFSEQELDRLVDLICRSSF